MRSIINTASGRANRRSRARSTVSRAAADAAALYPATGQPAAGRRIETGAQRLRGAILRHLVGPGAPGTHRPICTFSRNGWRCEFDDVPPGPPLEPPASGFITQNAPVGRRRYRRLHSKDFPYSNIGQPYGLPGSYRLPFATCWTIADELRVRAGRAKTLKLLLGRSWDGPVASQQLNPETDARIGGGGGFATAAGDLGATIGRLCGRPRPAGPPRLLLQSTHGNKGMPDE